MKHITFLAAILLILYLVSFSDVLPIEIALKHTDSQLFAVDDKSKRGNVELLDVSLQGVTIQFTIPKSDFKIDTLERNGKHIQTISFSDCRFMTEPNSYRLPMKTALIGVPADASFTVRIVERGEYNTHQLRHKISRNRFGIDTAMTEPVRNSENYTATNRFLPSNLAKIGKAGWIRQNRILPLQIYPVQYNPVSGVVKFYHRLVVEIQFNDVAKAPSAIQGLPQTESAVYEEMFGNMLINPQTAKQWRSPGIHRNVNVDLSSFGELTENPSSFSIPSAPTITSPRYKITISKSGMYHITSSDLVAAGIDISTIKPNTLTLSNKGKQIPIFVRNYRNGQSIDNLSGLDPDSEIIFYGQRHSGERSYIDPNSDVNIYWLSWNEGPGLRMETTVLSTVPRQSSTDTRILYQPKNFLTRVHFEKDNQFRRFKNFGLDPDIEYDEVGDGILIRDFNVYVLPDLPDDSWFWAQISAPEKRRFPFKLHGVAGTGQKATMRIMLHGRSEGHHSAELWLNNKNVLRTATWTGDIEHLVEVQQISQSAINTGTNTLEMQSQGGYGLDLIMLNWFEIDYWRTYAAQNDVLPFSITLLPDDETGNVNPNFKVELRDFTNPKIEIYGVDGTRYVGLSPTEDEDNPGIFNVEFQDSRIGGIPQIQPDGTFALDPSAQYVALTSDKFLKPVDIIKDAPSDLRGKHNGADYIIITDTEFVRDAQPLANFRSQQGLRTKIVEVQDIYDEFNHGIPNPYALRDFLKYAYENWQTPAPTYVLLLGDTNPKEKTSFVPTIQIQVPGYGSSASDHPFVTFRGDDGFPDMLIGRVPAGNSIEVRIFVERAINYENNNQRGPWYKRILMLAGSDFDFHYQTDSLIEEQELTRKYETKVVYAPPTAEEELSLGEGVTPVGRQVLDGFNTGASLVNYVGHGGGGRWASSRMMDLEDPHKNLTNISQLPFVISMTCFTGEFDSPSGCLAEELLRSDSGGAIAVIGGTSIGLLLQDHVLNQEIFDVIFNDKTQHLGAIVAEAKTQFLIALPGSLDLAHVFTLFGDPATKFNLPHTQLQITTDVKELKDRHDLLTGRQLSVSGTVPYPDFSGNAEITVVPIPPIREGKKRRTSRRSTDIDARHDMDDTPRLETVAVSNGKFTTQVPLPYNSAFEAFNLRVYAWNSDEDAIGYSEYTPIDRYIKSHRTEPYPAKSQEPVHVIAEAANHNLIDEMTLYWSEFVIESLHDDAEQIPMVRVAGSTYKTKEPIFAEYLGGPIDYFILVRPKNGYLLQTETVTFDVGEADLTILDQTINWSIDSPYLLSAEIVNQGTVSSQNVPVRFFQMPVPDNAEIPEITVETLKNAIPIGDIQMLSDIPADGVTVAGVHWTPAPGRYLVTVYVDMPTDDRTNGILDEQNEYNNIASRIFVNTRVFLTSENIKTPIQSSDGLFRLSIPEEHSLTLPALTFETEAISIKNQPDIVHATNVGTQSAPLAYRVNFAEQVELMANVTFIKTLADNAYIYRRDDATGNWIRIGEQTESEESISAEIRLPGTFALLTHTDTRPPALSLTVQNQGFIDGDYISDTPTITARIEDANGIDPRPAKILLTKNGQRVSQDEYTVSASATNSNILLITYSPVNALSAGDLRIRLQAHDANGNVEDAELNAKVAGGFEIKNIANFPNPFRPGQGKGKGTDFAYYLTQGADKVSLKIYTLTGKLITSVDTLDASTSYNEYHFDGLDADGDPLANGVYIYKFTATKDDERVQKVGKIVVIK